MTTTHRVDPRLIADAEAEIAAGNVPRKDLMRVYAAIRQARELTVLAQQFDAESVLLRAVGFNMEMSL